MSSPSSRKSAVTRRLSSWTTRTSSSASSTPMTRRCAVQRARRSRPTAGFDASTGGCPRRLCRGSSTDYRLRPGREGRFTGEGFVADICEKQRDEGAGLRVRSSSGPRSRLLRSGWQSTSLRTGMDARPPCGPRGRRRGTPRTGCSAPLPGPPPPDALGAVPPRTAPASPRGRARRGRLVGSGLSGSAEVLLSVSSSGARTAPAPLLSHPGRESGSPRGYPINNSATRDRDGYLPRWFASALCGFVGFSRTGAPAFQGIHRTTWAGLPSARLSGGVVREVC